MDNFVESYRVSFKVTEEKLKALIIGDKGEAINEIQSKSGGKIDIQGLNLTITGSSIKSVKDAEKLVFLRIENNTQIIKLPKTYASGIIGKKGASIKEMMKDSNAFIKVKDEGEQDRLTLIIMGRTEAFKNACALIFRKLEGLLKKELGYMIRNKCFRTWTIPKGIWRAVYVPCQVDPNPRNFFVSFCGIMFQGHEEIYKVKHLPKSSTPPRLSKNCGVLARYDDGLLYRAEVLDVQGPYEDEEHKGFTVVQLALQVKFIDFGNVKWVKYSECKPLESRYLYPGEAVSCQIYNLNYPTDAKNAETITIFQQALGEHSGEFKIEVHNEGPSNGHFNVDINVDDYSFISSWLVHHRLANYISTPFEPPIIKIDETNKIGSGDILIKTNEGHGLAVRVDVASSKRFEGEPSYTSTSHLKPVAIDNSIKTAITVCQRILQEDGNNFLENNKFHISTENPDAYQHQYDGPSGGASFAICMLSECLSFEIPRDVCMTGELNGHGEIKKVGALREKIVAAADIGKRIIYVPEDSYVEALSTPVENIKVIAVSCIRDLMNLIRN